MTNSNIKFGVRLLACGAALCIGTNVFLIGVAPFVQFAFPDIVGSVLYLTGPLPLIPAVIAGAGALLVVGGVVQDAWGPRD